MEKRYCCKQCDQSFTSGKVLGGHMRRHLLQKSAKEEVERVPSDSAAVQVEAPNPGARGYGLRENPKKSWKASDSTETRRKRGLDRPLYLQGLESTEALLADVDPICPVRRKRSLRVCYSPEPPPSPEEANVDQPLAIPSPVFKDEQDVKELAFTLMLLSRGLRDPEEGFMEEIPSLVQVDQMVKDSSFGAKKASESDFDHKEAHPRDPSKEGKLRVLGPPVAMVYRETKHKNPEDLFIKGLESKEPGEGCGDPRGKPTLAHGEGEENRIKIKIKNGSADHGSPAILIGEGKEVASIESLPPKENKPEPEPEAKRDLVDVDDKKHTCRTCLKVFGSGQALGGHKRVHNIKDPSAAAKAGTVLAKPKQPVLPDISNLVGLKVPAN